MDRLSYPLATAFRVRSKSCKAICNPFSLSIAETPGITLSPLFGERGPRIRGKAQKRGIS